VEDDDSGHGTHRFCFGCGCLTGGSVLGWGACGKSWRCMAERQMWFRMQFGIEGDSIVEVREAVDGDFCEVAEVTATTDGCLRFGNPWGPLAHHEDTWGWFGDGAGLMHGDMQHSAWWQQGGGSVVDFGCLQRSDERK